MKLHVPTGPLPILPPFFAASDPPAGDWEELDVSELFDRPADDDLTEVDLVDLAKPAPEITPA